ncbi:MAG TPA: nuclear transport factor 2 family protein [Thermoleophilaceae bacterium]|nr:nuclear transport factor 2 family protein [Thermoleophilaceae bacterium]
MSNIEVFGRCLDAISIRDVRTLIELSTEDIEVRPMRALLEDTVYRGREGIEQWMRDLDETWLELRVEVEEIHEPVAGSVVALCTLHGRGHGSEAPTQMPVALTAHLRDGLVSRATTYVDREAALREASGD